MPTTTNWKAIVANTADLGLPVLALVTLLALLVWIGFRLAGRRLDGQRIALVVSFGMLGGIVGAIGGSSQQPLVGVIVSGLIGVLTSYGSIAYGKEANGAIGAMLPSMICVLLLTTLFGLATGQEWRKKWDNYNMSVDDYRTDYDKVYAPVTAHIREKIFDLCVEKHKTYDAVVANCPYRKTLPKD